jgi:hypothetical protein
MDFSKALKYLKDGRIISLNSKNYSLKEVNFGSCDTADDNKVIVEVDESGGTISYASLTTGELLSGRWQINN